MPAYCQVLPHERISVFFFYLNTNSLFQESAFQNVCEVVAISFKPQSVFEESIKYVFVDKNSLVSSSYGAFPTVILYIIQIFI